MREPILLSSDGDPCGLRFDINQSVNNNGKVWFNVRSYGSGFCFAKDITPDQADALADALREEAYKARKVRAELDANAAITAAGMVA